MLSVTDPLLDKVAEGNVQELGNGEIVVVVEDLPQAPSAWRDHAWRVDKGSNRLSYARQLDSLVRICLGATGPPGAAGATGGGGAAVTVAGAQAEGHISYLILYDIDICKYTVHMYIHVYIYIYTYIYIYRERER